MHLDIDEVRGRILVRAVAPGGQAEVAAAASAANAGHTADATTAPPAAKAADPKAARRAALANDWIAGARIMAIKGVALQVGSRTLTRDGHQEARSLNN